MGRAVSGQRHYRYGPANNSRLVSGRKRVCGGSGCFYREHPSVSSGWRQRDVESTYELGVSVRESSQRMALPSIELDRGGVGCGGQVNGRSPPMPIRAGSHRTNPRARSPINPFTSFKWNW